MNDLQLYKELVTLADLEQQKIERILPKEPVACLGLFVETVQVLDFMMLGQPGVQKAEKIPFSVVDLNMIEMGWNLATSLLLKEGNFQGVPMHQSTKNTRKQVMSLLSQLGIIIQLRRTAEMVKAGLVKVQKNGSTYTFSHASGVEDQFLDELELGELDCLEEKIKSSGTSYKGWKLVDHNIFKDKFWQTGNFMSVKYENEFVSYKDENIDSYMIPLIKQWDLGDLGIMIGYDSSPEIDNHFMATAAELFTELRDEAGIHPNTKIGNIFASDIMAVTMMVISFHIKHIHFTYLASEKDHEINIPQSLSIWTPVHELIKNMSDFSGIDQNIVKEAVNAITLRPENVNFLRKHSSLFRPLLIDIGSGFVFRPVSSVLRNPLHSIYALLESKDSSSIDRISHSREEWIRHYLYAIFGGTRYQRVQRNIKIRLNGKIITDIDASIYDNLTGELALIQIKWQNYFTNDVKKLRSKAKNFVAEINRWTEKIGNWVDSQKISHIVTSLQLKGSIDKLTKSNIYLFGLSKNAARMQGYGYRLNNDRIAVGTWAQFTKNRSEIGPAPQVISKLFLNLKEEENTKVELRPIHVEIPFAGVTLEFKNIWNIIGEKNEFNQSQTRAD